MARARAPRSTRGTSEVHARYIAVADTRVPHGPASCGPVASSPTRKTVRLSMRDHPGPYECCEVLGRGRAGHQELQILGADGTAGHGEQGFSWFPGRGGIGL